MHAAAERPTLEIVQVLLDKGADVNARATDGASPLLQMLKAATGPARVKQAAVPSVLLLIQRGADVNAASDESETPLAVATAQRMTAVVRALLDKGADPNKVKPIPPGPDFFASALMYAGPPLLIALSDQSIAPSDRSGPESAEIALLLIEHGADVNARGANGNTPLIRALLAKYNGVVRALLAKGADPNMSAGNPGGTPLVAAGSNEEMRKLLIAAGAKP